LFTAALAGHYLSGSMSEMPFVESSDGVRIFYEESGVGSALLLSHAFRGSSVMWLEQTRALSDRYQVIVWDVRGHGRSDSPRDPALYSLETSLNDILAVMRACQVERAAIGGLSLGGLLSIAFCLAYPEKTSALLLFDTGPAPKPAGKDRAARAESELPGIANVRRGILESSDKAILASLGSIRVPTLVLCGALDHKFLAATDFLCSAIPGADKVILEGAAHLSNVDRPDAFNAAVTSFLDRAMLRQP
jgi:pimeloyl-ACP methyl ester carboxylesterase